MKGGEGGGGIGWRVGMGGVGIWIVWEKVEQDGKGDGWLGALWNGSDAPGPATH